MSNVYDFRDPASVDFTKAPTIAIAGPSGCGKTESALRLARGFCGPGVPFAVIDSEEKRALYKRDRYQPWKWLDLQPPFSPENCAAALEAAKGYAAVVFDSGSVEYCGEGGLQDIHAETLTRMCKGEEWKADKLSGPAWKDAKLRHKMAYMRVITRYPTLLIVCLRAEPKVKFVKTTDDNGRTKNEIVDAGYQPLCEKQFMYDMLVGCQMTPGAAGIPEHIKKLERDLEPVFLEGRQIDESTGERLAAWCKGKALMPVECITPEQVAHIETQCNDTGVSIDRVKKAAQVATLAEMPASKYEAALKFIADKSQPRAA